MKRQFLLTCSFSLLSSSTMLLADPAETKCAPIVESALLQPSDVGFVRRPDPQVLMRLEDPVAGGVLPSGFDGSGTFIGPREEGTFSARVAVEFLEPNTSIEVRVVDDAGAELNFIRLHSAEPGGWSGSLAELPGGQTGRVELSVKEGRALGTIYRVGNDYVTTSPILSRASSSRVRGRAAFALKRPAGREPLTTGSSYYSSNYAWEGTNFTFVVSGGPANTCGDLWTYRNGSWVTAYGWLCTDGSGYGVKGPWYITTSYPGQDQTDFPSYIQWPDQSTTEATWHIIDVTPPTIDTSLFVQGACGWQNQSYCYVAGNVSDGYYGSGFNLAWSYVELGMKDETTGKWWMGTAGFESWYELFFEEAGALRTYGGTVWNTRWESQTNWAAKCPSGHTCTMGVKIYDHGHEAKVVGLTIP